MTAAGGLQVTRRHPLIGTEVRGVDLSQPLDDATFEELHALWMEHLLLIIPDQAITDEQHIAFGRRFGELEAHPSLAIGYASGERNAAIHTAWQIFYSSKAQA